MTVSASTSENLLLQTGRPLVEVHGLTKLYPVHTGLFEKNQGLLSAVEDVDLTILQGETLGLVGESGSGKSTLARLLVRLIEPTRGRVFIDGEDVFALTGAARRRLHRKVQIVFQDPFSSMNPRHSVRTIIGEGIELDRRARRDRVVELCELVGLSKQALRRYPHEFSGGQRQRIAIARALAVEPDFLILDEPVSALDVSIQSTILNLLAELKERLNLTYLFISHDLSVVKHISDRIAVMYLGHLMEVAPKRTLFESPLHPYTQTLLSAVPRVGRRQDLRRIRLEGEIPTPINVPRECRFVSRCFRSVERCRADVPPLERAGPQHDVRCINYAPLVDEAHLG